MRVKRKNIKLTNKPVANPFGFYRKYKGTQSQISNPSKGFFITRQSRQKQVLVINSCFFFVHRLIFL
jgi:hypothetical protein